MTSRTIRRRRTVVGALALVVVGGVVALTVLVTRPAASPHAAATARTTSTTAPPTTTTSSSTTTTTTTFDVGTLPQTMQFPSATDPAFTAEMAALWSGIVSGSVTPALSAFFPRTAYLQLKTGLPNPSADWQERLIADYQLDIEAAHALLGPDAAAATLVSVSVPAQYGHWIGPGVCANGIGYFEVANSRIVYQQDGVTRSIGIASLISWRGEWYVVHLGAILRSGGGEVDQPATGPGYSAPSSTC
jgi:hypothetical protein